MEKGTNAVILTMKAMQSPRKQSTERKLEMMNSVRKIVHCLTVRFTTSYSMNEIEMNELTSHVITMNVSVVQR